MDNVIKFDINSNVKVLKLISGEFLITEVDNNESDEESISIMFPAVIIPVPNAQGQQGLGFSKFLPFSESSKSAKISRNHILVETDPIENFLRAYDDWKKSVRAQESGIITPNMHISKEQFDKIKKGIVDK